MADEALALSLARRRPCPSPSGWTPSVPPRKSAPAKTRSWAL